MMVFTFIVIGLTVALFISGKMRTDLIALLALMTLYLGGVLDAEETLSGFSDSTVILIAVLFVVGEGISSSGIANWLGYHIVRKAGTSESRLLLLVMIGTALLSAFVSSTGTVAMMLPVVVAAVWRVKSVPSRFLLPVAIVANIAGALTLISSTTNIIVADAMRDSGLQPFGFFEFGIIGLPLMVITIAYLSLFGKRLLPTYKPSQRAVDLKQSLGELSETYLFEGNSFWLSVSPGSDLVGRKLGEVKPGAKFGVTVLHKEARRQEHRQRKRFERIHSALGRIPRPEDLPDSLAVVARLFRRTPKETESSAIPRMDTTFEIGDALLVKGEPDKVQHFAVEHKLGIEPIHEDDTSAVDRLVTRELGFAEVVIPPRSTFENRTVPESKFTERFDLQVVSVTRRNVVIDHRKEALQVGDTMLVRGRWAEIGRLRSDEQELLVVGQPEALSEQVVGLGRPAYLAMGVVAAMIVLMVIGILPTVMVAFFAALAMVLLKVVTMPRAYRSINWSVVVLIAALVPMGTALSKTGGVEFMADGLVNTVGAFGPLALLAGVFILACGFSQIINNVVAALLIAPVALQAAVAMNVSPEPFMMMVAVGVITGIMTPVAGAPMMIVMNPGGYSFKDYAKVGFTLVLLVFAVSMALVPVIWPL